MSLLNEPFRTIMAHQKEKGYYRRCCWCGATPQEKPLRAWHYRCKLCRECAELHGLTWDSATGIVHVLGERVGD